jgi:hypothetical protein
MSARKALADARAFFKEGEFAKALARYEHFFDHSIEEDESWYGVRLSYCLDEWARLGSKYPPALERLEFKAAEAHDLLLRTRRPAHFHDYIAVCEHLRRNEAPIEVFLTLHRSDRELAESVVQFIWDELVEARHWDICTSYLPDPDSNYAVALRKFDESMAICTSDPSLGGAEFEEQIKGWYVLDVTNIVRVLVNSNRSAQALVILAKIASDMQQRSRADIATRVHEQELLKAGPDSTK